MQIASIAGPARAVLALFVLLTVFSADALAQHEPRRTGELIVRLAPDATIDDLRTDPMLEEFGLVPIRNLVPLLNIWLVGFDEGGLASSGFAADNILALTRSAAPVQLAQYNHKVEHRGYILPESASGAMADPIDPPDDPLFSQLWGLHNTGQSGGTPGADIDALAAWGITTGGIASTGEQVVVAIVDNGFDLNHPDLYFFKNEHESSTPNGQDDDGNGYIDDYHGWNAHNNNGVITSAHHGTHVSGTAAARGNNGVGVVGVNWDAAVMPIQGLSGNEAIVVAAYGYVLTMRQIYNNTGGEMGAFVVATNASFGVDYGNPANFPIWCGMYDELGQVGIVSTGATMNVNANVDTAGDVPTACPSNWLISVTNTTHNDTKAASAAYGLNTIELGAPGSNIHSTTPNNGYGNASGTSMATPHVTGAIALVVSSMSPGRLNQYRADPAEVALQIRQAILDGTDYIGIQTVTGGRLNLNGALVEAMKYDVPELPDVDPGSTQAIAFEGDGVLETGPSFRFPRGHELAFSSWAKINGPGVLAELSSDETLAFRLEVVEQDGQLFLRYSHKDEDGNEAARVFNQRPLDGVHHIAMTRGDEIPAARLILDGQRLGQPFFYTIDPSATPGDRFYVGNSGTGDAGIDAVVDEVRLFRNRLLMADIQQAMHHTFEWDEAPSALVAYYRFEADTTGFAWDFSNSGNSADLDNYTRVESPFPVGMMSTMMNSSSTMHAALGPEGARILASAAPPLNASNNLALYILSLGDGLIEGDDVPDGFVARSEAIFGAYGRGDVTASLAIEIADIVARDLSSLRLLYRPDRTSPWVEGGDAWVLDGEVFSATHLTTFGEWTVGYTQFIGRDDDAMPQATSLEPAYPNPFTSAATVTLNLQEAGSVMVEVLDLLGRRVMVLHEGLLTADRHELHLDGGALAPGTYIVRASSDDFSLVRRVTLVR